MEKIHKLILGLIPNQKCNFKCEYCYISQLKSWDEPEKMKYSPEHIAKSLSKERLGGISLINLTGNGETLLQPEIADIIKALLNEGHFVEVVTNGTITKRINEILNQPDENLTRLFFKLSFHYKELKRLNLLNQFFDNVRKIKESGASFTLELMAYDSIENDIEDIKKVCLENVGAVCQATIGRNDKEKSSLLSSHSKNEYHKIWEQLESPMLDFKMDMLGIKRKEFCYAGAWSMFVNMYTGEAQPCYRQPYNQNVFDLSKPILFEPVGHFCSRPYCINSHAHLTWGLIPELKVPEYEKMRNRTAIDGSEWLSKKCKDFFNTKLYETNKEFSTSKKFIYSIFQPFRYIKWYFKNGKNNTQRLIKHGKKKFWKKK
jgi:organic radical activating enzyme